MKEEKALTPVFVEFIPDVLEDGKLYVSMEYATVVHLCCCGCGKEVVTPLSPADWGLSFNGRRITLYPSIGNWSFPCRSHYWIKNNRTEWADPWSQARIDAGRSRERLAKECYFRVEEDVLETPASSPKRVQSTVPAPITKRPWWKVWWPW